MSAQADEAKLKAETIAFDDAALIQRCRAGDMQAFGLLVAKYQDRLFNTLLRIIGRSAEAEELTQEAFLRAIEKLSQFRGESKFYTWLFRIGTNLAITRIRRQSRVRFRSLDSIRPTGDGQRAPTEPADTSSPGPVEKLIAKEKAQMIAAALEELDDEHRVVIVLRDVEEMDYAAIADVLEIPAGTVKSRLHRGRNILKDKLANLIG